MKNSLVFILFILLLSSSVLSEENKYNIDKDGNIILPPNLDSTTKTNIQNIAKYVAANFPSSEEGKGSITIDPKTQLINVITSDGKEFARIPKGFVVEKNPNDFIVSGKTKPIEIPMEGYAGARRYEYPQLVINELVFDVSGQNQAKITYGKDKSIIFDGTGWVVGPDYSSQLTKKSKLTIKGEGENRIFDLIGEGDLTIGKEKFKGIKDALIKTDKKQIYYAKFKSTNGADYYIHYKDRLYFFRAQEGGEILFNPLEKEITGKRTSFEFPSDGVSQGGMIDGYGSTDNFKVTLNDKGEVLQLFLGQNHVFTPSNGQVYSTEDKAGLNVFFGESDKKIKDFDGNAILFRKDNIIEMKGLITRSYDGVKYNGLSKDTYTEVNTQKANFQGDFFNVVSGEAKIYDSQKEVIIKDGDSKLKILSTNKYNIADWGFSYVNSQGQPVEGLLYGYDQILKLKVGNEDKITSIPFSSIGQSFKALSSLSGEDKQTKVDYLNKEIDKLDKEIKELESNSDGKSNPELEKKILDKITKQNILDNLNGKTSEKTLEDFRKFVERPNAPEDLKASARLILKNLIAEKSMSLLNEAPKIYSVNNRQYSGGGYMGMGDHYTDQSINFEINSKGKVNAYYFNGKRIDFNGADTEIPSGLSSGNLNLINNLIENNNFDTLRKNSVGSDLKYTGYSQDSPEYKELVKLRDEAIGHLDSARNYYKSVQDENTLSTINIESLKAYQITGENSKTISGLKDILGKQDLDASTFSKASNALAFALYNEDKLANAGLILSQLRQSIDKNPEDLESRALLQIFSQKLSDTRGKVMSDESEKILNDFDKKLGVSGNYWSDYLKSFFKPVTTVYNSVTGTSQVDELKERLGENNIRLLAKSNLDLLRDNGIDSVDFFSKDANQRFEVMSKIKGLDEIVSQESIRGYISKYNIDLSKQDSQEYRAEVSKMMKAIEDQYGPKVASNYAQRFARLSVDLGSLDTGVRENPDLYVLATNGKKINGLEYTGTDKLEDAFKRDRAGKVIEKTWTEAITLGVGDFGATMLYGGAMAKAASQLASLTTVTKNMYNAASIVLNPGQAAALKLIGGESLATTALGISIDVPVSFGYGAAINKLAGEKAELTAGIAGIVFGGRVGGKFSEAAEVIGGLRQGDELIGRLKLADEAAIDNFAKTNGLKAVEESPGLFIDNQGKRVLLSTSEDIPESLRNSEAFTSAQSLTREEFEAEFKAEAERRLKSAQEQISEIGDDVKGRQEQIENVLNNKESVPEVNNLDPVRQEMNRLTDSMQDQMVTNLREGDMINKGSGIRYSVDDVSQAVPGLYSLNLEEAYWAINKLGSPSSIDEFMVGIRKIGEDLDKIKLSQGLACNGGECIEKAAAMQLYLQKNGYKSYLVNGVLEAESMDYAMQHAFNVIESKGKFFLVDVQNPIEGGSVFIAPIERIEKDGTIIIAESYASQVSSLQGWRRYSIENIPGGSPIIQPAPVAWTRENIGNAIADMSGEMTKVDEKKAKFFRDQMANAVDTAEPDVGNHKEVLNDIIDVRKNVARQQGDSSTQNSLFVGQNLINGKPLPPDSLGSSVSPAFSGAQDPAGNKNAYVALYEDIQQGIFNNAEEAQFIRQYRSMKDITEGAVIGINTIPDSGGILRIYNRPYILNGEKVTFTITETRNGYLITHMNPNDKKVILQHLDSLWNTALSATSNQEKAAAIAEYEWWFMTSNPANRAGASIGDSMSMILQKKAGLPLRDQYRHIDFVVLSTPKDKYVKDRTAEILASK